MDKNIEQLNKLAKLFNADKIITADEIDQILKGVLKIMTTFKKENEDLTSETKSLVENIISEVSSKYEELKNVVDEKTIQQGMSLSVDFNSKVKEIKDLIEVVKTLKPENGKDADEERVIEEVLSKIKLPKYKETVLDDGAKLAEKLNGFKNVLNIEVVDGLQKRLNDIQMNVVSSLPQTTSFINGKRAKNINFTGATVNVAGDTATVAITGGGGGSILLQTDGVDNGSQDTLNLAAGTNITISENGSGRVTIEALGDAVTTNPLSQFASTSSSQLAGVISDETGTGKLVFADNPKFNTNTGLWITSTGATPNALILFNVGGKAIELDNSLITVDRIQKFPDASGTFPVGTGIANELSYWSATNTLGSLTTATYPSLTELAYVKGVTSAIQTQLGNKLDTSAYDDATGAETTTGTSTAKYVSPDGLAGSDYGKRTVGVLVSDPQGSAITTGDGKACFRVPSTMNGWNLVTATASVSTVSSSGIPTVQVRRSRRTNATTRSDADMLSTKLTIDASEFDSVDAAAAVAIDTSNDDVNTGDNIYIDIDVAGTGAKGLFVELTFQLP